MKREWTCCQWLFLLNVEQDPPWQWQSSWCVCTGKLLCNFRVWKHYLKELGGMITRQKSKVMFSDERSPPNLSFYNLIAYLWLVVRSDGPHGWDSLGHFSVAFGLHMLGDIITSAMMDSKINSTESTACICVTYIIINTPIIIINKVCTILNKAAKCW